MAQRRSIVWFREDLRLHDNEAIFEASKNMDELLFVYVFDDRFFKAKTSQFGFPKTDRFRLKFILESITDLRKNLKSKGANLIVRVGKTEDIIADLAVETKSSWIFCNRERTAEEVKIQDALEKKLWSTGREIRYSRGKMLYYTQDLPFPVHLTPDVFTNFRKEVEKVICIRQPLPSPEKFNPLSIKIDFGNLPSLEDFGFQDSLQDEKEANHFKGGETAALERLHYYLWETKLVKNYKETRNELLGADYSTKFSAWLAHGCLSPKQIFHELRKFEDEHGANDSTYWVFFELLWRDFFRLQGKKYGNKIFQKNGTIGVADAKWKNDSKLFDIWAKGKTGIPFIDANMLELKNTGYMSNRGRQNVASFLVKDLQVNWQMGAEYFESLLIDYDPCSNWCNWNYIAGVGSDPRENRYFNILKQAKTYDSKGDFVKYWLPQLNNLPENKIHQPDSLSAEEQQKYNLKIGVDYPKAMINTKKWE